MHGLIPSLAPFYEAFLRLCGESGTWTGDIYHIRKALRDPQAEGSIVTKRLTSLERRGMLTFTREKPRHKRIVWTVTVNHPA